MSSTQCHMEKLVCPGSAVGQGFRDHEEALMVSKARLKEGR